MASVIPSARDISIIVVETLSGATDTATTTRVVIRSGFSIDFTLTVVDPTIPTNSTSNQTPPATASQSPSTPSHVLAGSYVPAVNSTTAIISTGNQKPPSTGSQSSPLVAHNDASIARIVCIAGGVIGGVILAGAIFLYVLRTKRSRTHPSQRRDTSHDIVRSESAAVVSPTPSPLLDSDRPKNTGDNNAEHLLLWRSTRVDSERPASIVSPYSAVPPCMSAAHLLTEEEFITRDLILLPNPPSSTNRFACIMSSADRRAFDAAYGETVSLSAPPPPHVGIDTGRAIDSGYRFHHMVPPTPHSDQSTISYPPPEYTVD